MIRPEIINIGDSVEFQKYRVKGYVIDLLLMPKGLMAKVMYDGDKEEWFWAKDLTTKVD